jgi:signal transduction histidine kinase
MTPQDESGIEVVDILAVDDAPSNLVALDAVLASAAVNVVRAASGRQALALMETRELAVVILDAQMPGLDGFEVARRIRDSKPGGTTPIIFLTAFDVEPQEVRRAYASGAVDFVIKPFDPDILRSKVAVFVDLFRQRRQAAAVAAMRARIDRERAEAAARDAEHQRTERLKDEFLATLAHELRTPLMSLMVAADSLERMPVPNPAMARMHDLIHSQLAHLSRLVEDSLEVARFTQGKIVLRPGTVDLRGVVRRAVELSQAAIDACGVDVTVALPAEPVSTNADAVRVAQAVSNVVNNAAKFSHWGGKVAVSLEATGGQATIRVRDWGRGIPRANIERIFDPFVQSEVGDTWRGGLGIGLALVTKLVELHGGHVEASSAGSGLGAEFTMTLPLTEARAEVAPDDVDRGGRAAPETPRRVLVVDDSREVRSAVQLMLQLAGHSVVTADCGRAALVEIERSHPDIVLMDIDLPDVDGYAVATTVRAAHPGGRPHLVAITGKVGPAERDKALRTGFDAHVPKPIDGPTLIRVVAGAPDPGTSKSESSDNQ